MEYGLFPSSSGGRELENDAAEVGATSAGRAIQIASRVEDEAAIRACSAMAVAFETVEHALAPFSVCLRRQAENGSAGIKPTVPGATSHRSPVQAAVLSDNDATRKAPLRRFRKICAVLCTWE